MGIVDAMSPAHSLIDATMPVDSDVRSMARGLFGADEDSACDVQQ